MNQFTMLGAEAVSIQNPWIQETFRLEQAYLLSLEPKRLLAPFRETAGLPKEGEAYGGWEKTQIRGHTMGHYLTAMAQAWSATKDRRILDRLEETAAGLAEADVAVGISYSGESRDTVDALKAAKQAGACTIAVTNFNGSTICRYADILICTSQDQHFYGNAIFSRATQILIVDMIYMGLISSDYEHYVNQLNKCENVVRRKAYENN